MATWLNVLDGYVIHEYREEETVTDVAGDLAVVLQRVRMRATVLDQDRSGSFVITDVWRRSSDGWRIWRRHSTPLDAGELSLSEGRSLARLLAWRAAWMGEQGFPYRQAEGSVSKLKASKVAAA